MFQVTHTEEKVAEPRNSSLVGRDSTPAAAIADVLKVFAHTFLLLKCFYNLLRPCSCKRTTRHSPHPRTHTAGSWRERTLTRTSVCVCMCERISQPRRKTVRVSNPTSKCRSSVVSPCGWSCPTKRNPIYSMPTIVFAFVYRHRNYSNLIFTRRDQCGTVPHIPLPPRTELQVVFLLQNCDKVLFLCVS